MYVLLILYLLKGWLALKPFSSKRKVFKTKITILIAARNEEKNIALTIEAILAQNYPKELTEIIIVDDHSTDNTTDIIRSYQNKGVKLIQLNEAEVLNSYKKKALTEAIHVATGELMVATDADCQMGPSWLSTIVSLYEEKGFYLISSPVLYFKEENVFEELQTLEFLYLIGLGAASIGNKQPSTCNGANLAYKRDVFMELKGFQGIDELASGDDELFLHKVAAKYPEKIGFCKSNEAVVYTEAKKSLTSFISQRKRWASKSTNYKRKSIVFLGIGVWMFNVFLFLSIINAIINPEYWVIALSCFTLKLWVEFFFMLSLAQFFKRFGLLIYLPILSFIHVFYLIYIGIAGNSGKYYWKGRWVN
jgi:cellulose synthase/poly-beta-1,6-N-acetylglucosamine synthase-like glycosyltransferase